VPASALVAELVSALLNRSDRAVELSLIRARRFARLEQVLRVFDRPSTIEAAARQVAAAAREIFDVGRTTVVLRDRDDKLIPVTEGPPSPHDPGRDVARLVAEAIQGDEPCFVPTREGATMLVLPLPAGDAPAGAVLAYPIATDDPDFTLDLARLFGVQIGIAIDHLYLIHELTRATRVDELTGIGNRRHADALLASLAPGDALIVIDLDGFKAINDTYGHPAGDQLLQTLSAHLRSCLRDSDTSARLGGDEFLIVARRAHADPLAVARRILDGWDYQRHRADGPTPTLSAGVALHEKDRTSAETFDRADRALYEAKRRGKNQAQLWDPVLEERL
jgi:diguanylate cyclase (GGDEF)-like protein